MVFVGDQEWNEWTLRNRGLVDTELNPQGEESPNNISEDTSGDNESEVGCYYSSDDNPNNQDDQDNPDPNKNDSSSEYETSSNSEDYWDTVSILESVGGREYHPIAYFDKYLSDKFSEEDTEKIYCALHLSGFHPALFQPILFAFEDVINTLNPNITDDAETSSEYCRKRWVLRRFKIFHRISLDTWKSMPKITEQLIKHLIVHCFDYTPTINRISQKFIDRYQQHVQVEQTITPESIEKAMTAFYEYQDLLNKTPYAAGFNALYNIELRTHSDPEITAGKWKFTRDSLCAFRAYLTLGEPMDDDVRYYIRWFHVRNIDRILHRFIKRKITHELGNVAVKLVEYLFAYDKKRYYKERIYGLLYYHDDLKLYHGSDMYRFIKALFHNKPRDGDLIASIQPVIAMLKDKRYYKFLDKEFEIIQYEFSGHGCTKEYVDSLEYLACSEISNSDWSDRESIKKEFGEEEFGEESEESVNEEPNGEKFVEPFLIEEETDGDADDESE